MTFCDYCLDTGLVCENHPTRPWDDPIHACGCGGAGMPCQNCCSPIPENGTVPIGMAFVPDHLRPDMYREWTQKTP